jgi:hypothetical protein
MAWKDKGNINAYSLHMISTLWYSGKDQSLTGASGKD